jgi:hypothetical protein
MGKWVRFWPYMTSRAYRGGLVQWNDGAEATHDGGPRSVHARFGLDALVARHVDAHVEVAGREIVYQRHRHEHVAPAPCGQARWVQYACVYTVYLLYIYIYIYYICICIYVCICRCARTMEAVRPRDSVLHKLHDHA